MIFKIALLVWFLGWGLLCLLAPSWCFRLLSRGRNPNPNELRRVKIVGYMGLVFSVIALFSHPPTLHQ